MAAPSSATAAASLSLTVRAHNWISHDGMHQADHTVLYEIGTLPSPQPPHDNPPPADHISVLVPEAVKISREAWNTGSSWPNIKFCTAPCSENRDGRVTPIKIASSSECKTSVACATFAPTANHITSSTVWIEDPPAIPQEQRYFQWTGTRSLHEKEVPNASQSGTRYYYMPSAMLHEFGHLIGLDDLKYNLHPQYNSFIMGGRAGHNLVSPLANDLRYLYQVYREHGGKSH